MVVLVSGAQAAGPELPVSDVKGSRTGASLDGMAP